MHQELAALAFQSLGSHCRPHPEPGCAASTIAGLVGAAGLLLECLRHRQEGSGHAPHAHGMHGSQALELVDSTAAVWSCAIAVGQAPHV